MEEIIEKLKKRIRVRADTSEEEIRDLDRACRKDLEIHGVYGNEDDPLYYQAIVLYCKAHYGYDEKTERFLEAYESLRDSMELSGDYQKEKIDGDYPSVE